MHCDGNIIFAAQSELKTMTALSFVEQIQLKITNNNTSLCFPIVGQRTLFKQEMTKTEKLISRYIFIFL